MLRLGRRQASHCSRSAALRPMRRHSTGIFDLTQGYERSHARLQKMTAGVRCTTFPGRQARCALRNSEARGLAPETRAITISQKERTVTKFFQKYFMGAEVPVLSHVCAHRKSANRHRCILQPTLSAAALARKYLSRSGR